MKKVSFCEVLRKNSKKIEIHFLVSLREKCPNTELLLVRIFPHSDWIRRDTKYLSVFSPNAGKYGPEKTLYLDTFHAVFGIGDQSFPKNEHFLSPGTHTYVRNVSFLENFANLLNK